MKKHLALCAIVLCGVMVFPANGNVGPSKKKKDPVKKEEKKPEDKYGDLVKKCKKKEGLLTFFTDTVTGKTYLEIQKSQLNQEFIYFNYIENAPVETGYHKGAFGDSKIVVFKKNYERLEIVQPNTTHQRFIRGNGWWSLFQRISVTEDKKQDSIALR